MQRELAAEFVGTFALVSAVCGSALFSAPQAGLIAIAFALAFRCWLWRLPLDTSQARISIRR